MTRAEILQAGFGLASLMLAVNASPMLVTANQTLLHQKYSTTISLGLLLDFAVLGPLCSLVVYGISRIPEGVIRRLGFVLLIYLGLRYTRHIFLLWMGVVAWIRTPQTFVASRVVVQLVSIALVILAIAFARRFYSTVGKFGFLLPGIAIFALLMCFQLARAAVVAERALRPPVLTAAYPQSNLKHRVVWILYDELSYREVFDSASSNRLSFPAFESLRAQSLSFRNVVPAAYMTEYAVPGLLLGSTVEDVGAEGPRELSVRFTGKRRYTALDPQATIFGELHREHLNSAVMGWYYPYCDLLASVVSTCDWETDNMTALVPGMFAEQSVLRNAVGLLADSVEKMDGHRWLAHTPWETLDRQQSYHRIMSAALSAIAKPGTSLIFLHLPLPHPPGFYDRNTHTLSTKGSYLDNLILADRTLQILFDAVHQSQENDVTAVIVTSDHSWRINMWRKEPGWLQEEEAAAPHDYDSRIPLLVHFPHQTQPVEIEKPLDAIRIRSLISDILNGQLETPDAVSAWASETKTVQADSAAR